MLLKENQKTSVNYLEENSLNNADSNIIIALDA
jgi:hypothetical protein